MRGISGVRLKIKEKRGNAPPRVCQIPTATGSTANLAIMRSECGKEQLMSAFPGGGRHGTRGRTSRGPTTRPNRLPSQRSAAWSVVRGGHQRRPATATSAGWARATGRAVHIQDCKYDITTRCHSLTWPCGRSCAGQCHSCQERMALPCATAPARPC